jgi:hypothetical protein
MPTFTFEWHEVKRPAPSPKKREEMFRRELEDRAAMLHRLGYTAKAVKARLKANVAWDFELEDRPKHATEVDKIVDAVFRRGA